MLPTNVARCHEAKAQGLHPAPSHSMSFTIRHVDTQADPDFALGAADLTMRLFPGDEDARRFPSGAQAVPYATGWITKGNDGKWFDAQGPMPDTWEPAHEYLAMGAAANATTDVVVGQVWRDTDYKSTPRHSRVIEIIGEHAGLRRCFGDGRLIGSQETTVVKIADLSYGKGWAQVVVDDGAEARQRAELLKVAQKDRQRAVLHARAQKNRVGAKE